MLRTSFVAALNLVSADFELEHGDAISLLQLRASQQMHKSTTKEKWIDHPGGYQCQLMGDPHVRATFVTTDIETGQKELQPDFNGGAGIFHMTKSDTCDLDFQMYNCPLTRKNSNGRGVVKYGMTMIQGMALKSGSDLIEIAYKPLELSKWKLPELVGLTPEQWVEKVNAYCPEVDTDHVLSRFNEPQYFASDLYEMGDPAGYLRQDWRRADVVEQARAPFLRDFHMYYRGYMMANAAIEPGRCESQLWGVPLFPVITINGIEQPDWDMPCYSNHWWEADWTSQRSADEGLCRTTQERVADGGYIHKRIWQRAGIQVLKHPEGLWELAYEAHALQAEPIRRVGNNWTHAVATENVWKYFDPEVEVELYVKPECFPDDSVVPDTVCNAPVMRNPPEPGDVQTYPTTPIPPEESLFTADVLERMCKTCNWHPGEGKTRVEWKWTGHRDSNRYDEDPKPVESSMEGCVMPVLPPTPPPPPAVICEDNEIPLLEAETACQHLLHNQQLRDACIMDFCAEGGNPSVPGGEEGEDDGTAVCVGSECDTKAICETSITLDLSNVEHNNLGGLGPDEGGPGILYRNAATFEGRTVDVLVECKDGSYSAWKSAVNGATGGMGVIGVNTGTIANLEFTFLDSELSEPITLTDVAFSVFDVDTGKKGKAAESVEVCDVNAAVVTTSSELDQAVSGGCTKFTATQPGTAADNPSNPNDLDTTQSKRTATYQLSGRSKFTAKFGVEKGHGQRQFLFAFHPAVACME